MTERAGIQSMENTRTDKTINEKSTSEKSSGVKPGDGTGEGMLCLCATPIGNLEDMPPRAVRMLKEADLIAAEDTRSSLKLIRHFDIHTPLTSYHEFNKIQKGHELVNKMKQGVKVALITDAGMPAVSDPGEDLVRMCREEGIKVTCAPGASAFVTALALSGFGARRFCFEGFLPRDKKEKQEVLEDLKNERRTIILYEAPHRLKRTLAELQNALGSRKIAICRELTKIYETVLTITLDEAVSYYEENEPRGEYVLVIEGLSSSEIKQQRQALYENLSVTEHLQRYLDTGMDRKEAMKAAAKDRGVSKRDIYKELLEEEEAADKD